MLSNEYMQQLITHTKQTTIPLLFTALYSNTKQHWNSNVISLTFAALKFLMEMDHRLFSLCATTFQKKNETDHSQRVQRDSKWVVDEGLAKRRVSEFGLIERGVSIVPSTTSTPYSSLVIDPVRFPTIVLVA